MENNTHKDWENIVNQINAKLNIKDIAQRFIEPSLVARPISIKWNITIKSIYNDEDTPSLKISEALNIFHCFSSGKTGDGVTLYRDFKKLNENKDLTLEEACGDIINEFGLDIDNIKKEKVYYNYYTSNEYSVIDFMNDLCELSSLILLHDKSGLNALNYLKGRGFEVDTISHFRLGYIPDDETFEKFLEAKTGEYKRSLLRKCGLLNEENIFPLIGRILIPIIDLKGNVISFSSRSLNPRDEQRYIQISGGTIDIMNRFKASDYLYNLNNARKYIEGLNEIVLVEGYFDVMRLHQIGIHNVVAIQTINMSLSQKMVLESIRPLRLGILLDADSSGRQATEHLLNEFSKQKTTNNRELLYFYTYNLANDDYLSNTDNDPDIYFRDKSYREWKLLIKESKNYRDERIRNYINTFNDDFSMTLSELYLEIGDYLKLHNNDYLDEIRQILERYPEKNDYNDGPSILLEEEKDVIPLYLMRKLDAEFDFCKRVMNESYKFSRKYQSYEMFMTKLYRLVKENLKYEKSTFYRTIENRKLYGDKSTKFVLDFYDENKEKKYSIELDYFTDELFIFQRFEMMGITSDPSYERRNDKNFFDVKVFKNIYDQRKQEEAEEWLKEQFS